MRCEIAQENSNYQSLGILLSDRNHTVSNPWFGPDIKVSLAVAFGSLKSVGTLYFLFPLEISFNETYCTNTRLKPNSLNE
jgi:hypothetical protein